LTHTITLVPFPTVLTTLVLLVRTSSTFKIPRLPRSSISLEKIMCRWIISEELQEEFVSVILKLAREFTITTVTPTMLTPSTSSINGNKPMTLTKFTQQVHTTLLNHSLNFSKDCNQFSTINVIF